MKFNSFNQIIVVGTRKRLCIYPVQHSDFSKLNNKSSIASIHFVIIRNEKIDFNCV